MRSVCFLFALAVLGASAEAQCETELLRRSLPVDGDEFGSSLSIDGGRLLAGAPERFTWNTAPGTAHLYEMRGGAWIPVADLTPEGLESGDLYGTSLALSGDFAYIGAPGHDTPVRNGGVVFVYQNIGGTWTLVEKLFAPDGQVGDAFGTSLAAEGNRVMIGAPNAFLNGARRGAAYGFRQLPNGSFVLDGKLTAPGAADGDEFGAALDVAGDLAYIGAPGAGAGRVYVFRRRGAWRVQNTLRPTDGLAGDRFGTALREADGMLAVGAPFDDELGTDAGAVYLFDASLRQEAKVFGLIRNEGDQFGSALDFDGVTLIAGAPESDWADWNAGTLHRFEELEQGWTEIASFSSSDGQSEGGYAAAVALGDGIIVVGAVTDWSSGEIRTVLAEPVFRPFGSGGVGFGGVSPVIWGRDCPMFDQISTLEITRGRAGSAGALIYGTAPAEVPIAGGILYIDPATLDIVSIVLHGDEEVPGDGWYSFSYVVNDPAWAGITFYAQGVFLDSTSPTGFVFTNGIVVDVPPL